MRSDPIYWQRVCNERWVQSVRWPPLYRWGLHWLLAVVLLAGARPTQAAGLPQAIPTPDLHQVRKVILLRLADGTPVPGITVQLTPAAPALGGPPNGVPSQIAKTDASGQVVFTGLDQWIWMVSFTGQFQGRALQPVAAQGLAPYGRTRAGGGFAVVVEAQEEGPAPTLQVVAGQVQPLVEPAGFVLVADGDEWAPALDLAGSSATPWTVMAATGASGGFSVPPRPTDTAVPGPAPRSADLPIGLVLLPLACIGFVIYYRWRTRHLVDEEG